MFGFGHEVAAEHDQGRGTMASSFLPDEGYRLKRLVLVQPRYILLI
jgi:hypothetical protein